MKQKLLAIAVLVVLVPACVGAGVLLVVSRMFREEAEGYRTYILAAEVARMPEVAAAQALLADEPLLADAPAGGADAAPVLNRLLWKAKGAAHPGLVFPAGTAAQLSKWGQAWATHAADLDPAERALDLRWMADLGRFERWSIPADETAQVWLQSAGPDLEWAVKLRLLRGLRDGAPESAAAEVRALAKLVLRTPRRSPSLATALLRDEAAARDAWTAAGHLAPDWTPWTPERLRALSVVSMGVGLAVEPLASDAMVAAALGPGPPQALRCRLQADFIVEVAVVRDSPDPLLAPALARARDWLAHPRGCDFSKASEAWTHGPLLALPADFERHAPHHGVPRHVRAASLLPSWMLRSLRGTAFLAKATIYW